MTNESFFRKDDLVKIKKSLLGVNLYKLRSPDNFFELHGPAQEGDIFVVVGVEMQSRGWLEAFHPEHQVVIIDTHGVEPV